MEFERVWALVARCLFPRKPVTICSSAAWLCLFSHILSTHTLVSVVDHPCVSPSVGALPFCSCGFVPW